MMHALMAVLVHILVHLLTRVLVLLTLLEHRYDALESPFEVVFVPMNKLLHHADILLLERYV